MSFQFGIRRIFRLGLQFFHSHIKSCACFQSDQAMRFETQGHRNILVQRCRRFPKPEQAGLKTVKRYLRSYAPRHRSLGASNFARSTRLNHRFESPSHIDASPLTISSGIQRTLRFFRDLGLRNVVPPQILGSIAQDIGRRAIRAALSAGGKVSLALLGLNVVSDVTSEEDNLEVLCENIRKSVHSCSHEGQGVNWPSEFGPLSISSLEFGPFLGKGSNAAVYLAKWKHQTGTGRGSMHSGYSDQSKKNVNCFVPGQTELYPLAVKMLFNFTAESHAQVIYQAMNKEIIPARVLQIEGELNVLRPVSLPYLPPHPNIVKMVCSFTDQVPLLGGAHLSYPEALPARLNPNTGCGRNRTLYLVMKRYDYTLRDFLSKPLEDHTRLILTAQLLEAVEFLYRRGIAHRDMKSDNVLIDISQGEPLLVLTDFGCALAATPGERPRVPFNSDEVAKGGNVALMAPEIACATPGFGVFLDFSLSDLWAAGTLIYEIYGHPNPFYASTESGMITPNKCTYIVDQLPSIPNAPSVLQGLVKCVLDRCPGNRPDPATCATLCQLLLWAPPKWFQCVPTGGEVIDWLLEKTLDCILLQRDSKLKPVEESLLSAFLSRVELYYINRALRMALVAVEP